MYRFDLYNENLCDILEGLLQKYDIEPKLLGLEITESAYMENRTNYRRDEENCKMLAFRSSWMILAAAILI